MVKKPVLVRLDPYALDAPNGSTLMETLRDEDQGVEGTCGGMCSCGTCHVYVAEAWLDKLPPKTEDEEVMQEAIGELVEVRSNSRLSCQIEIGDDLAGLEIEVGPVAWSEAWSVTIGDSVQPIRAEDMPTDIDHLCRRKLNVAEKYCNLTGLRC